MISYKVYKITNTLNGKIYVGQTKQPVEKRFMQHLYADSPLGQAMRECGADKFGEVTIRQVFTMRLPPDDYEKLKTLSKKNKRSMAAELEYILEMYFEKYELQNGIIFVEEKANNRSPVNNNQIGNNNLFVNNGNNQKNKSDNEYANLNGRNYFNE